MEKNLTAAPTRQAPKQKRSRDKLERIYAATEQLFNTKGSQNISVQEIAALAGCSVGSVYQRFADKEALATAFFERFEEEVKQTIVSLLASTAIQALPLSLIVARLVEQAFSIYQEKGGLFRALITLSHTNQFAKAGGLRIVNFMADQLETVLRQHPTEFTHPEPKVAAQVAVRMLVGVLDNYLILSNNPTDYGLSLASLQAEVTFSLQRYLGVKEV
jgi:AcrR family transcriptional regulator